MHTRQEILKFIEGGETVNIKGIDYNKHNAHKVPSDADLAVGDEAKEADAEALINNQIAALQRDLKKLEAAKAQRAKATESESTDDTSKKGGVVTGEKADTKTETKAESKSDAKAEAKSDAKK